MAPAVVSLAERPDLDRPLGLERVWPEFVTHGDVTNLYWDRLYEDLPEFQLVLVDDESGEDLEIEVDKVNEDTKENPQESPVSLGKPRKGPTSGKKKQRDKFETGFSWIHISFPSAKDPSFKSRHGNISTCVVTIEADDDFVTFFDTKPKLFAIQKGKENSGDLQRLVERVRKDLFENYPQLQGKVLPSKLQVIC